MKPFETSEEKGAVAPPILFGSVNSYVTFHDQPSVYRVFLSSLLADYSEHITNGNITAEVDDSSVIKIRNINKKFAVFNLRVPRNSRLPSHVFGSAFLKDAMAVPIAMLKVLPAVGTHMIINPRVSARQLYLMQLYRFVKADFIWIFHVPCPIGVALVLRVEAPEIENGATTRGVVWKPQGCNTIAFRCCWNSDVSVVPLGVGREGQSGGSIKITTVESNTTDSVQENLNIMAWCYCTNVAPLGYDNSGSFGNLDGFENPAFNFQPVKPPPPPPEEYDYPNNNEFDLSNSNPDFYLPTEIGETNQLESIELHSAVGDIDAEGLANLDTNVSTEGVSPNILLPSSEKPNPRTKPPRKGTSTNKREQTSIVSTRWFQYMNVTLSDTDIGKARTLTLNPRQLGKGGEAIRLAFFRNLWVSGSRSAGYVRGLLLRIVISRPQQVSGLVEIIDSQINASSRYIVEFGGNVIFNITPDNFVIPRLGVLRDANNAWMKSTEAQQSLIYRLLIMNRTADIKDVTMSILVQNGDMVFQAPTKPRKIPTPALTGVREFFLNTCKNMEIEHEEQFNNIVRKNNLFNLSEIELHSDLGELYEFYEDVPGNEKHHPAENRFNSEALAPVAAATREFGETNNGGAYEEIIDQDEFWAQIYEGEIELGVPTAIPLNLAVVDDSLGDGLTNQINQKFERFTNIVPRSAGAFGPQIGQYIVKARLPQGVAADIAHVSLPGDMVDQTATYIFGLGSLASLATSAIAGVGGPLLTGVFNTIRDGVGGLIGGFLGAEPPAKAEETPSSNNPSNHPGGIMGGIDVARFINFLKPILANEKKEPTFGALLLELLQVVTESGLLPGKAASISKVPIQVFVRMDSVNVERTVSDREITPVTEGMVNAVYIPRSAFGSITENFVSDERILDVNTKQHRHFVNFVKSVYSSDLKRFTCDGIYLNDILDRDIDQDDYKQIQQAYNISSQEGVLTRSSWPARESKRSSGR